MIKLISDVLEMTADEAVVYFENLPTFQRLASLSSLEQTHIADKYYNGKKPWNEQSILE